MQVRAFDMFCGAGGSSAGARAAGAAIVEAVDAWALAAATYRDNFPSADVQVRELTGRCLPSETVRNGGIDLLLASPECTNHSNAKGAAPRCEESRGTSNYVVNFAGRLRPRWIVLENVVQLRRWHGYTPLVASLRDLGYRIRPEILDAADFGVPQVRRRLFLICDRDREPGPVLPTVTRHCHIRGALRLDGHYKSRPLYAEGRAPATLERAERAIASLGRRVPFLIVYYGTDGAGGWQSVDRPLRTLTTLDRFGLVTWQGNEPMLRMLQVDELREAMGFPGEHIFDHGARRDRIKMIGNSVAPPVMAAIVKMLVNDAASVSVRRRDLVAA